MASLNQPLYTVRYKLTLQVAALCFLLVPSFGVTAASQALVLKGGPYIPISGEASSLLFSGTIGARVGYADMLQLGAGLTYEDQLLVEAALSLHPLRRSSGADPYLFTGYGRFLTTPNNGARTVLPVGIGVGYWLNPSLRLEVEGAGRWTVRQTGSGGLSTDFGVRPTLGVAYYFGDPTRRERPDDLIAEDDPIDPADGPLQAEDDEPAQNEQTSGGPTTPATGNPVTASGTLMQLDTSRVTVGERMVLLPDGIFIMGLTDEDPLSIQTAGFKRITISSFYLDRFEATNADYRTFLTSLDPQLREAMTPDSTVWEDLGARFSWNEYFTSPVFEDHPVVALNYFQAKQFCEWQGKRLPTEAEWEYAARAGTIGAVYPWGGFEPRAGNGQYLANYNPDRVGYAADGYAFTAPIDAFPSNAWGIYNLAGNVAEWTLDAYSTTYSILSDFNPLHKDPQETRYVVRGGSWASDAFYIGVGVRDAHPSNDGSPYIGVRCASNLVRGQDLLDSPVTAREWRPLDNAPALPTPAPSDSTSIDPNGNEGNDENDSGNQ